MDAKNNPEKQEGLYSACAWTLPSFISYFSSPLLLLLLFFLFLIFLFLSLPYLLLLHYFLSIASSSNLNIRAVIVYIAAVLLSRAIICRVPSARVISIKQTLTRCFSRS